MGKIKFFKDIHIPLPKKRIYARLGFRDNITRLSLRQKKEVEGSIAEAAGLVRLQAAALRSSITHRSSSAVAIEGSIVFKSKLLAELLEPCSEVILMAATAGSQIVRAVKKESRGVDVARAVVYDATASEMVDASLEWIMQYCNQQLSRQGKALTRRRFSCGYGDFLLKNQKSIYHALHLSRLGVTINENYILKPEKSVTAIAGIKEVAR